MSINSVAVIGSGLAGLLTARLCAEKCHVYLITKDTLFDSNTQYSQGGIAAVWSEDDSIELHKMDTERAGDGLCDPAAVEILSKDSRAAIEKLIALGANFDTDKNNDYQLGLEGAHSVHRILHAGGDATGAEIQRALVNSIGSHRNIEILEHCSAIKIETKNSAVSGVRYLNNVTKEIKTINISQAVLATGGAGQLYKYTSNPDVATGEGMILAYNAGANLMDLEFYQFHPTALTTNGSQSFLISEALRGEGAILKTDDGTRIMEGLHPLKDLAPRNIVARALNNELSQNKGVFLDATGIPKAFLKERFPTIYKTCLSFGVNIAKDWIPVAPCAHYVIGGVEVDLWGRTTLPGLYACGEVSRTGVHGANRLASNSLLEATVFAKRVALLLLSNTDKLDHELYWPNFPNNNENNKYHTGHYTPKNTSAKTDSDKVDLRNLQQMMWDHVGLIREEASLKSVVDKLSFENTSIADTTDRISFELNSMKTLSILMSKAALLRTESRGAHFRKDYSVSTTPAIEPIIMNLSL